VIRNLTERVAALPWWHTIDFGHGVITPDKVNIAASVQYLRLPDVSTARQLAMSARGMGGRSFEMRQAGRSGRCWSLTGTAGRGQGGERRLRLNLLGRRLGHGCAIALLRSAAGFIKLFDRWRTGAPASAQRRRRSFHPGHDSAVAIREPSPGTPAALSHGWLIPGVPRPAVFWGPDASPRKLSELTILFAFDILLWFVRGRHAGAGV
jgi:hypothetical protein